ncbi:MAG: hypothetical protein AAGL69_15730 [Pseudomonadota bacterium]
MLLALLATAPADADVARAQIELIEIEPDVAQSEVGAQLEAAQTLYRTQLASGEREGALDQAKLVVELASRIWGGESPEVAKALTNLAIAQTESADFVAAQQNFVAAIQVQEAAGADIVGKELINPLNGLANASIALNDLEAAVPLFERSVHISHVTAGPNNLEQLDTLDSLSRTHYFLGDTRTANKIQDIIFRLQQRRYSADSDQYLDALKRRADWYTKIGNFTEAMFAYRRLERTIAKYHGRDDPRLIEPLVALAFVTPRQTQATPGFTPELALKEARRAVHRAVRIAREQGAGDPSLLPATLVAEGDFLLFATATRTARQSYLEAYNLTVNNPDLKSLHESLFAEPNAVVTQPIRSVYHINDSGTRSYPDRGFVELEYDLTVSGRPDNLRIVDSQPAGLMDAIVVRNVRRFVYRPTFVNGTPTRSYGVRYRHEFRYDDSRLSERERKYIERTERARARLSERDGGEQPEPELPLEEPADGEFVPDGTDSIDNEAIENESSDDISVTS